MALGARLVLAEGIAHRSREGVSVNAAVGDGHAGVVLECGAGSWREQGWSIEDQSVDQPRRSLVSLIDRLREGR